MGVRIDILKTIKAYDTIIIQRHKSPDPDALGSQGGLAEILRATFPEKKIYQTGGSVHDLDYLITMDEISDEVYQGALVIVTDTANAPRISDSRYKLAEKLIKIDHHPDDEPYGDLSWVNTRASSTSEMIYEFFLMFADELQMTDEAARLLYAGIVGDTGRFLYPATTARTLEIAAELRGYQFDATWLCRRMEEITVNVAHLSGYVWENMTIDEHGAGMVVLTQDILTKYGVEDSETSALIPLIGQVKGVVAWGIFVQQPEGYFRIRLRSKGPVINELAKRHHGGGHPLASGANAKDMAGVEKVYQEIQELVKAYLSENA